MHAIQYQVRSSDSRQIGLTGSNHSRHAWKA